MQKQKQQQDANADAAAGIKKKKVTAAQLRVQKGESSHDQTQIHNTQYSTPSIQPSTHIFRASSLTYTRVQISQSCNCPARCARNFQIRTIHSTSR